MGWFAEDMNRYFDDLCLDDNYQHQLRDGSVTKQEYEAVRGFHLALDQYSEIFNSDNEWYFPTQAESECRIINDPDWGRIVAMGINVWNTLKLIITDSSELEYMERLETDYLSS